MLSRYLSKISALTIAISLLSFHLCAQIDYGTQSSYKYLKGIDAVDIPSDWIALDFDDAVWPVADAPFRYGDGTGGTELTDMQGSYSTLYLRSTFTASNIELLDNVSIGANWDDGFILWINGVQILAQQAPAIVTYDALASEGHESGAPEYFSFNASDLGLVDGENTLAVFASNNSLDGSSDFYFDMSISGTIAIPELPEMSDTLGQLSFSHQSGFYEENFSLSISTPIAGSKVVYTLDGTNPQTSSSRLTGDSIVNININPESDTNRFKTPAVIVRASAIMDGFKAMKPESRTFIFLQNVMTQSHPGGTWPPHNTSDKNTQFIDYDMDSEVVNDALYSSDMEEAFMDIPSISVITDNANLFDSQSGIYVNAEEQGYDWEKECSVELLNHGDSTGFNVNAGLRIRGGWSRHNDFPKHSFRLFFREEYGDSKLRYPLFEDEGASEFDKVDLRCSQNYSWANSSNSKHNTFVREVFTRDSQKEAGHQYTRSRYYHLYLNGMYWGMYQTQERAEARFASSYFGGDYEDYDVIKINGENYSKDIMATDGTLDKWKEIYDYTQAGFTSNEAYYRMEGKDTLGNRIPGAEVFVDIDNLIDYMINIFFSGNYDSPVSAWGGNKSPNNMYAITKRDDITFGFKFFIHDGEHAIMDQATSGPGVGLNENRANIGDRTGSDKMLCTSFNRFHPQWLHFKLSQNQEYRIRFANRAWEQLTGDGLLTPEKNSERFNKRVEQIDMAIIAESARWGDTRTTEPYTKDNAWLKQIDAVLNDYFPYRTDILIDQLKILALFPDVSQPVIESSGSELSDTTMNFSSQIEILLKNPATSGEIYYTLDGSDPRQIGGEISENALKIGSGVSLSISSSVILRARILDGDNWSAVTTATFLTQQTDYSDFQVTEINYHPTDSISGIDTIQGKSFEFIEFKNISQTNSINLTGLVLDSAVYYEFPESQILTPEEFFVVSSRPKSFLKRYGIKPSGNYENYLSNGGEQVVVYNANNDIVLDFEYDDNAPWPQDPDGNGLTLVSAEDNPLGDPSDYSFWKEGTVLHGTPFYQAAPFVPDTTIIIDTVYVDTIIIDTIYIDTIIIDTVIVDTVFIDTTTIDPTTYIAFQELEAKVYPNPTRDLVRIKMINRGDILHTIRVFDLRGTVFYKEKFTNDIMISMKELELRYGLYLLEITSSSGGRIVKKVIYSP
jgi:hypothetical protein